MPTEKIYHICGCPDEYDGSDEEKISYTLLFVDQLL